jgi:hypothetical protein
VIKRTTAPINLGGSRRWASPQSPYRPVKEFVEGGGHFDGTLGVARVTGDW